MPHLIYIEVIYAREIICQGDITRAEYGLDTLRISAIYPLPSKRNRRFLFIQYIFCFCLMKFRGF